MDDLSNVSYLLYKCHQGFQVSAGNESQSLENEESCRLIRTNYGDQSFSFKSISKDDIIEAGKKLSSNKT